jgi:hypothetical protein
VEQAELIFDRSIELAKTTTADVSGAAIDLFRAADHDEATLRHAAVIGRRRRRRTPQDRSATRGAQLLDDVIAYLGFRARAGDARTNDDRGAG